MSNTTSPTDYPTPQATPEVPSLKRTNTDMTMHPPGAWRDTVHIADDDDNHSQQSPMTALGNAFGAAAQYLPAGVVNTLAPYAPGLLQQPNSKVDDANQPPSQNESTVTKDFGSPAEAEVTKEFSSPATKDLPAPPAPNPAATTNSLAMISPAAIAGLSSHAPDTGNSPEYMNSSHKTEVTREFSTPVTSSAFAAPSSANNDVSKPAAYNISEPKTMPTLPELTSTGQFASPPTSPASPASMSSAAGFRHPKLEDLSTTAVSGHSRSGTDPPPPTAATATRDNSMAMPSTTASTRDNSMSATSTAASSITGGMPSSIIAMKSGQIGSDPTGSSMLSTVPSASPTSQLIDGVTPGASELEKSDLGYLAPAIRPAGSAEEVPTTLSAARTLNKQEATHPAPVDTSVPPSSLGKGANTHSSLSPDSAHSRGHSRGGSTSSGELSTGSGSSPRRKVSLANRLKGEAKIIKGRLTKNQATVHEGRVLLGSEQ